MPSDIRVSGYAGNLDPTSSVGGSLRGNDSPGGFDSLLRLPPQLQQDTDRPPPRDDGAERRPLQSVADRPAYAESARPRPTDAPDDEVHTGSQASTDGNKVTNTDAAKPVAAQTPAKKQAQTAAKDAKADDGAVNSATDADDPAEYTVADDAAALAAAGAAGVQVAPVIADDIAANATAAEQPGIEPITAATTAEPLKLNGEALTAEVAGATTVAAGTATDAAAVPAHGAEKPAEVLVEPVQQVEAVTDAPYFAEAAIPATVADDAAPTDGDTQLEVVTTEELTATTATPSVVAASANGASAVGVKATAVQPTDANATANNTDETVDDRQSPAQLEPSAAAATTNARLAGADEKQNGDNDKPKRDEQNGEELASAPSPAVAPATFEAGSNVDKAAAVGDTTASRQPDNSGSAQPSRSDSSSSPATIQLIPVDAGVRQSAPVRLAAELLGGGTRSSSDSPPVEINSTRFLHRVASAFVAAEQRGGEVRLRLSPSELGAISVEVKLHEGALTARVETETAAAKTAVVEHLSQLRERLAEQGVRIERFDVDVRQQGSTGTPSGPGQQQDDLRRQTPRAARTPVAATSTADVRRPAAYGGSGSLNVIV